MSRRYLLYVLVSLALSLPAWAAPGDYLMFRGDPGRSGYRATGPSLPLELRWTFQTLHGRGRIEAYPAVDDGLSSAVVQGSTAFVGAHDGYLYALDLQTGEKRWEFATGGRINSTPALDNGNLYFGSTDNRVYALRARDGQRLWNFEAGVRLFRCISYRGVRSSPLVAGGTVFVGGCDGRIRALDAENGELKWEFDTGTEGAYASPAWAAGVLLAASDGLRQSHLFALDPQTGKELWRFASVGQLFATPAVADGAVYLHARDDHLYALRLSDGSFLWKTPAPDAQSEDEAFRDLAKSSPAVDPERLYVGIGRSLVALDRRSGRIVWQAVTHGRVDSSPLVLGRLVFVGSDDRSLYAFSADAGEQLWSFATGGRISSTPSWGGGFLLIGANDGLVYAFAPPR